MSKQGKGFKNHCFDMFARLQVVNMIVFYGNVKGLPFEKLCEIFTSGGFHGF